MITTITKSVLLFGVVWLRTKCGNHHPNVETTVVAPGATASLRLELQLNSGPPEATTTLQQHWPEHVQKHPS